MSKHTDLRKVRNLEFQHCAEFGNSALARGVWPTQHLRAELDNSALARGVGQLSTCARSYTTQHLRAEFG